MMGEDRKIPEDARREQNPTKRGSTWGRAPWPGTSEDPEFDERMSGDFWVYVHDLLWDFIHQVLSSEPGQEPVLISLKLRPPSSLNMCFEKSSSATCQTHICNTISRSPKEANSEPTSRAERIRQSTVWRWRLETGCFSGSLISFVFFSVLPLCLINNHHLFGA